MTELNRKRLRRHTCCHYCGRRLHEEDYVALEIAGEPDDGPPVWATCRACSAKLEAAFA